MSSRKDKIMVTLLDLKKEKMAALKAHDQVKGAILGVLISAYQKSEIEKKAKGQDMSDADMVSVLNHALKELQDEKAMYESASRTDEVEKIVSQMNVVKGYLPQMMSEDEIKAVIEGLADKSIKSVMMEFKTKYNGKADMGLVSRLAKEYQK